MRVGTAPNYSDSSNCNTLSIDFLTTPNIWQGLRLCTNGSGLVGWWQQTP